MIKLVKEIFDSSSLDEKISIMSTYFRAHDMLDLSRKEDDISGVVRLASSKVTAFNEIMALKFVDEMCWPLTIATRSTFKQLLSLCMANELYIPTITFVKAFIS